jgi:predicted DCC family thiol-disulfide oxidoreductase YuxK
MGGRVQRRIACAKVAEDSIIIRAIWTFIVNVATHNQERMAQMSTRAVASGDRSLDPVLLYDDSCGFCNAAVQTVLRHEKRRTLRFASLRGEYGLDFRARHPEFDAVDSMIWFSPSVGAPVEFIAIRSDAALATADYMGGFFRFAAAARLVPRRLRDTAYDFVARHRHRLLPPPQECLIPSPEQRARFLP